MNVRRKNFIIIPLLSFMYIIISTLMFNLFTNEVIDFNSRLRNWIVNGGTETISFNKDGIPESHSPRYKDPYVSPFYVVHFGLIYSEECKRTGAKDAYHWKEDTTLPYWPQPDEPSLKKFKASVDWLIARADRKLTGQTHFLYDFDWNYPNHGVIRKPWWSGLTDGHAITLLLRAYDCFGDQRYLLMARDLYTSVTTPVAQGGSLVEFAGHPWIEEYVDPNAIDSPSSRVLNGMAYAYFGVRAYEEETGILRWSPTLSDSIRENINTFDLGYWSYYDAIGNRSNYKYHNVNTSLLKDPRLYDHNYDKIIKNWSIGGRLPILFFSISGPNSIEKFQYIITYFIIMLLPFVSILIYKLFLGKQENEI